MVEKARFEELDFYQLAMELLKAAYELAERLPTQEKYNLADQLRRAVLSTTLNIAEGYGRYHFLDRLRFFYYARGSLYETLSGFIAAHAVGYVDDKQIAWVRQTVAQAGAALNAYINYIRKKRQGAETFGDKYIREPDMAYEIIDRALAEFPDSSTPGVPNPATEERHE